MSIATAKIFQSWVPTKNESREKNKLVVNYGMVAWIAGRLRGPRQSLVGRGLNK